MHVYVSEHIISLYYRAALWVLTKLGRDEELIAPQMCKGVSARFIQGEPRAGQK